MIKTMAVTTLHARDKASPGGKGVFTASTLTGASLTVSEHLEVLIFGKMSIQPFH